MLNKMNIIISMNRLLYLPLLAVLCPVALSAQSQGDRYAEITNPDLTSLKREAPRATFTSYVNEDYAELNNRKDGTFRLLLNGTWQFNYVDLHASHGF